MSSPPELTPPNSDATTTSASTSIIDVLFMSNSEHGQINVSLAAALEVARNPLFRVHVAAFKQTESSINAINSEAKKYLAAPITFHPFRGPSLDDLFRSKISDLSDITHGPGFFNSLKSYRLLARTLLSSKPEGYLETYQSCIEIIEKVKPAAIIVESALFTARDAVGSLGLNYMVIAPSSIKEIIGFRLPGVPYVFKWPMCSSGYQFPLSFLDRIKNTALAVAFIFIIVTGGTMGQIEKARKAAKITNPSPMQNVYVADGVRFLLPFIPETDYNDLKEFSLPENIVPCGPITAPEMEPMHTGDPEMFEFLQQRPTVLVNLGSIWDPDAHSLEQMLKGLDFVLASRPDIQILWKLKVKDDSALLSKKLIDQYCSSGRLKIVSWLKTSPSLIVDSGNVACFVHHGGANSYFEACRAGVPQLVLPVWLDTYEFAERARHLGLGLIGNIGCAPGIESQQLGSKLLQVLNDDGMKKRANEVRAACKRRGEGREIAAAEIKQWAENERSTNQKQ